MKQTLVFASLAFSCLAHAAGAGAGAKEASLKKIQQACEKNIVKPKVLKERIDVCKCVVRNHEARTSAANLVFIEEIYSKKSPPPPRASGEDLITEEQSQRETLFNFDSELAEECLKNSKYILKK